MTAIGGALASAIGFLLLAAVAAPAAAADAANVACERHEITVAHGDTLIDRLRAVGVATADALAWTKALSKDDAQALRRMRPGDRIETCVAASDALGARAIVSLRLVRGKDGDVTLVDFGSLGDPDPVPATVARIGFDIRDGLDADLRAIGIARATAEAIASCVRRDRDLPDALPAGTHVTLVASGARPMRAEGVEIDYGGRLHKIFHYRDSDGRDLLVDGHGRGVMALALKRPVASKRITSGWGWRTHPVLNRPEFHKGVDYGAKLGAPVRAAAGGVVTLAKWHGNYGRLVEIRHARGVATRYGHLSRFAHGIHRGTHVERGDVIGYVGASGLATGPHLYFELYEGKTRVDPTGLDPVIVPMQVPARERPRFSTFVHTLTRRESTLVPSPSPRKHDKAAS